MEAIFLRGKGRKIGSSIFWKEKEKQKDRTAYLREREKKAERHLPKREGKAMEGIREGNQVRGKHFRFTVLTERLLRLEYSEKDCFVDGESQMVVNRSFPPAEFHWEEGKQGE